MNAFLEEIDDEVIGLSSIGRDGERVDVVSSTHKPAIYLRENALLATAKAALLQSDASFEILNNTQMSTPMGNVMIVRLLSGGYVDVAGPSTGNQMAEIASRMLSYGADRIFIDGALSRVSTASPLISDALILSTGAQAARTENELIEKTMRQVQAFSLEKANFVPDSTLTIFNKEETLRFSGETIMSIDPQELDAVSKDTLAVGILGALQTSFVKELLKRRESFDQIELIVTDGTKVFLEDDDFMHLKLAGIDLRVCYPAQLLAISINPMDIHGTAMNADIIFSGLKPLGIPLLDVKGMRYENL